MVKLSRKRSRLTDHECRALVYVRVSSKRQTNINRCETENELKVSTEYKNDDNKQVHYSSDMQQKKCVEYACENSLDVVNIINHVGSAYNENNLDEVFKYAIKNDVYHIIVYSVCRLSRWVGNALSYIESYPHIKVHSVWDNFVLNNEPFNKHMFRMILSSAQYESELLSKRVKDSVTYRKKIGAKIGKTPFGYKTNKVLVDGKTVSMLALNHDEQKIIDLVTTMRDGNIKTESLNDKITSISGDNTPVLIENYDGTCATELQSDALSYGNIADLLNEYGIQKRGSEWNANQVRNLVMKDDVLQVTKKMRFSNIS